MSIELKQPHAPSFAPDPAHPFIPKIFQTLRHDRLITRRSMRARPRVLHLVGSLAAGGAERQLVNLSLSLAARNIDVAVMTLEPLEGRNAFYLPALRQANIPVSAVSCTKELLANLAEFNIQLPNWLRPFPLQIAAELLHDPPDVLHAWLDFTNIAGAIAGLIAGVPRVILSTRNVNPTHFPYLSIPWYEPWYKFLATIEDIHFINNSVAGQHDYAAWMNVAPGRFHVVRNGIDTARCARATAAEIANLRSELSHPPHDRLITGVFRLSDEKRPLLFLDTIESLLSSRPAVQTAIFGQGPLESQLRHRIAQSPHKDRIRLLPPRQNLLPVYCASHALLQTSVLEGTPNTVLEAQAAGCPVVITPGGGAEEAMLPHGTGYVGRTRDELVHHLATLLDNPALHAQLSGRGPSFVETHYGLRRMVEETVAFYAPNP